MRGDLDQPPVVIRRSRAKAMLFVVVCIALAVGSLLAPSGPDMRHALVGPVGLMLFTAGSLFYGAEAVRPDRLVLSPLGLRFDGLWKNWSYRWEEVSGFRVWLADGRAKVITFDIRHPHGTILDGLSRGVTEKSASFIGLWELSPEKLAKLLNEAHSRWGDKPREESAPRPSEVQPYSP